MEQPSAQRQPDTTPEAPRVQEEVLVRVGHMTRMLHENLRGLGFDKLIAKAAHDIPDARDRLDYVARMTEQAAQRVLTAAEIAGPLQEQAETGANALAADWRALQQADGLPPQLEALVARTVGYLSQTEADARATRQQLLEIMLAQDFQDLTGQVIKRVTELAHGIEQQLLQLLIDYAPPEARREVSPGLLNGPQIKPESSTDVVSNQRQVDDLLDSLGF